MNDMMEQPPIFEEDDKKKKKDKKPNKFVKALRTIFVDNALITLLSLTLAVILCVITAAMA